MTSFIAKLKSQLPEVEWPVVVAALRNQAQVWAELQDTAFGAQALQAAGAERAKWSPAYLGLLRLDQSQHFESLRAAPLQPVPEKLRYQAAAAYEQLANEEPGSTRANPDLAQATLLALALRERRRLLNGWEQLSDDVSIASAEYWELPIACLLGFIPTQHELLQQLLAPDQSEDLHRLGVHALVSNPLTLDVQSSHLLEIIQGYELPQLMSLLRRLAQVRAPLAQQAALQALENLQEKQPGAQDGLSEIQGLLLQAEIYQLSDQPDGAAPLLHSAWEASQVLQADLAYRVAEATGEEAATLTSYQRNAELTDTKQAGPTKANKRPAALLSAARVALKADDEIEAVQMGLAALKAATHSGEKGREKANLLSELSELFIRLSLPQEAELAARAAMDAQANNPDAANLLSLLLQSRSKDEEALQFAHLAAALAPERSDLRRSLALALQANQQAAEAFAEWKAVLELEEQPNVSDWLSLAETALASGHADETVGACQQALDLQPANGTAHALMGKAVASQGDAASAIDYLRRATELAPGHLDAWLALADLLRDQGCSAEAETSLRIAQAHTTPSAELQALLAELINDQGRSEDALLAFQLAAQLAAEQAAGEVAQRVALSLSALQRATGQLDAARETLEGALRSFPGDTDLARAFGSLLLEIGEPKRALSSLKIALQATPEDIGLQMDIARAYLAAGEKPSEAEQALREVLTLKSAPAEAKALLAQAIAAQGNHMEAVKQFDAALKTELIADPIWRKRLALGKALSLAAGGKPVAAINTLKSLDKEQPGDLDVLRALCGAYRLAGRADEAASLARKVYFSETDSEESLVWYSELMLALGKSAEACAALRRRLQNAPLSPRAALSLGFLQWEGESQQAALSTIGSLLKSDDASSLEAAAAFLLKNASSESIAFYRRALDLAGPNTTLLDGLTKAYLQNNQLEKSLEILDQAIQLAPHRHQNLELKAEVLQQLGKPKAALQALNAALELLPRDAGLLSRKAALLRAGQDWNAALEAGGQAFELDPGHAGYLQCAAELAVLCLQPSRARGFFATSKHAGPIPTDLAYLQAELALESGEEIAAAKSLAAIAETQEPRALALQSRLAACRGDRAEAAELLHLAMDALARQAEEFIFSALGVAMATEELKDWEGSISSYQSLAKAHPGLPAAQFGLGRTLTLRAEWQQLCDSSGASQGIPGAAALSKQARASARQAFEAAAAAINDSVIQTMLAGWQQRAELRFGAELDLEEIPEGFPGNPNEAAALLFAAQRSDNLMAAEALARNYQNTPEVLIQRALQDDQADVFAHFSKAAKQLPQSAPVQALAAQAAVDTGKDKEALPLVQRALALWPSQPGWHALAGQLQQAQGRLGEASQHFKLAVELEPKAAKYYFALGQVQAAAKLIPAAMESLEKAVDLQPRQAEYLLALAKAHRLAGDDRQAKSLAQQAHKAAPDSPAALLLQAELALEDKDALRAKDLVEQALRQAPKDAAVLQLFAESLYALGQAEDAVAVLDRAAKASSDEVPVLIRRAQFLTEGRGLDALVKLSQKYPQRAEVFFALSQMLALTGNLTEAVQAAQHAVKKVGIVPAELGASIHLHLGLLLKHSGNLDQSLHHLDEAIRLRPQAPEAYLERGRVFLSRRQHGPAIAAFRQAAAVAPLSPVPHFEAGLALKDAKDYTAAENELRKAAKLAPKDRNIQRQLAAIIALNLVHHRQEVGVQS